jgi:dipeptidyl-peptidase-4
MGQVWKLGLPVLLAGLAALPTAAPAAAAPAAEPDSGFLEQYAATYRFRLGRPTAFRVAPDGRAVLFLRSGPRSFVQDLYEIDVATGRERVLLTAEQVLRGAEERLPPEERARRERLRVATRGIVSFELSEDGRRILVPLGGGLYVVERATGAVRELTGAAGYPEDPHFSPDGARVACVKDGDLYVFDVDSGRERRLTEGASDTLTHGVAEFVAQEEMDRFRGYWWSPDGTAIAYQETDLAPVELLHILDPIHPEQEPQAWRYPRAGTANAVVRLGIIPAAGGPTTWVTWDAARFPYLATVRWDRRAPLTVLVQNRRQTEEALLAVDERDGATRALLTESDPAWINLDQEMPHWLADGSGFLWTTERGGAWQLELRGRDGRLVRALTAPTFNLRGFVDLDDRGRVAWVLGGDDPTQQHVFRVPLDAGRGGPRAMTHGPGRHGAVFGEDHRVWVHTVAGPEGAPRQTVVGPTGRSLAEIESVAEEPGIRTHLEFVTVGSRGYHAVLVRPADYRPGTAYPVIVSVYGGPHYQQVTQAARSYLLEQWLADHGFIVVSIDGRGTPARGRAWERALKGNLIEVPLADQVEALQALGAGHPELDLTRVGVYGWSFGGYFAALATMRRPDVFRAGVAGAPVTDWRDYDTQYTERYMDLPDSNAAGYRAASALTCADRLERPLLIAHGTADDNVFFLNSMKLCDALFRAGKPFEFLPLTGFTHMVPDPLVTARLYERIAQFLEDHVARAAPAPAGAPARP